LHRRQSFRGGGDASLDDVIAERIAIALKRIMTGPAHSYSIELPAGLTQAQTDEILANVRDIVAAKVHEERLHAFETTLAGMFRLALDATGADIPPMFLAEPQPKGP